MGRRRGWRPLAALLGVAGVAHAVHPRPFVAIVPPALGHARFWVHASGLAEVACAAGLAVPRTRRHAALAAAALFVAVYPANVQMAVDAHRGPGRSPRARAYRAATLARLPMQVPLVLEALRVRREAGGAAGRAGAA